MAHLARRIKRVGVDHDQPGAQCAEHRNRVMQHVGQLHRDALAGLEVGVLLQVTGKRRTLALKLGVGEGNAHAAECRTVGKGLAGTLEDLDHRLVGAEVDGIGDSRRAFVIPEIRLHYSCPLYLSVSGRCHADVQQ